MTGASRRQGFSEKSFFISHCLMHQVLINKEVKFPLNARIVCSMKKVVYSHLSAEIKGRYPRLRVRVAGRVVAIIEDFEVGMTAHLRVEEEDYMA